jgi:hypothetical protein
MCCAALPYVGQATRTRWLDTGSELHGPGDNHVYLSEIAVAEAARMFGWVPGGEVRARDRQIAELQAQRDELTAELAAARRRLEAIDVIESEGFRARKKPGRPAKEAVT